MRDFPDNMATADYLKLIDTLGGWRPPDLTISPSGSPYLARWHVIPRNADANVYLHVQVSDDPRDELHDHPWSNVSVILAGGYIELLSQTPSLSNGTNPTVYVRNPGDTIFREAHWAHRLIMRAPYTMTLFSTGPKVREWGYWFPDGWHHNERHNVTVNGVATFQE